MSTTDATTGPTITRMNDALTDLPEFALRQLVESKQGRSNTRTRALNASLPEGSWEVVDETVIRTQEQDLRLVSDLQGAGLVTQRELSTKIDTWPRVDDRGEAEIAMSPDPATEEGSLTWDDDGVPVPVIYDHFSLGFRETPSDESGRSTEEDLDTLGVSTTTRRVDEAVEKLFVEGWDRSINSGGDGYTLYGLTNHPQANTGTVTEDWTDDNTVIYDDVRRMRRIVKNDNEFSPGNVGYWLYLGTEFYDVLDDPDPDGSGDQTVRDRVAGLSNIEQIRELDYLGDKEALLFRPTEDVVDVGIASDIQPIMWESPFRDHWAVLGAVYPRVKSTLTGQSGVVHFTV